MDGSLEDKRTEGLGPDRQKEKWMDEENKLMKSQMMDRSTEVQTDKGKDVENYRHTRT